jgi:hypothetical protein
MSTRLEVARDGEFDWFRSLLCFFLGLLLKWVEDGGSRMDGGTIRSSILHHRSSS